MYGGEIMGRMSYTYEQYRRAMELLNEGLGPTVVSRILGIPERTVKAWKYEGKMPPLTRWYPEPGKELAYILGVLYGDGYLHPRIESHIYEVELEVKDYEFAETFSRVMSKLLNKKVVRPKWIGIRRGRNYG